MTVLAHPVHRARGRLRLRIPARRHDSSFFVRLVEQLSALPGVLQVTADPVTAGVLIRFDPTDAADPVATIERSGLLRLVESTPTLSPALTSVRRIVERMDQGLADATRGVGDLRTLTVMLLLILAARQATRGQFLGPATSLLWSAYELMRFARPAPDRGHADLPE
jgi:hypothetical protein